MRARCSVLVLGILLFGALGAVANPVMIHYFSELRFTHTGWEMELTPYSGLDGCWITSRTDTAFLNPTVPSEDYVVITPDSLQSPLFINPTGDSLSLYLQLPPDDQHLWDFLVFGDHPQTVIAAPPPGCSISLRRWYDLYYLDASPTLGMPNDTTDAMGDIDGIVSDEYGNSLRDVKVVYGYDDSGELSVLTDSTGCFLVHDFACREYLWFQAEGCADEFATVQIWPDSTVALTVVLQCEVGIGERQVNLPSSTYLLFQNQPNPFTAATTIEYFIPVSDQVEISIFDLTGNLVEQLFEGTQQPGLHRITWQPYSIPSGTYLYTIRTRIFRTTRRCQLLK